MSFKSEGLCFQSAKQAIPRLSRVSDGGWSNPTSNGLCGLGPRLRARNGMQKSGTGHQLGVSRFKSWLPVAIDSPSVDFVAQKFIAECCRNPQIYRIRWCYLSNFIYSAMSVPSSPKHPASHNVQFSFESAPGMLHPSTRIA